ncbi:MAG TPA: hypothetical protein VEU54_05155 [Steroidobacteraceae bacterium]|jgi:hypothetical protein|nr:hypothetical protein [Steroidobacteraceae bacterium]
MSRNGGLELEAARTADRAGMPAGLRATLYVVGGLLWLTGCLWLVLHLAFPQATAFGPLPNPWEALVLRIHGWAAACGLFLFGWVTAAHVSDRWRGIRSRLSGVALALSVGVIAVTGYALYYTTGRLHDGAALVHEGLGVAAIALVLAHGVQRSARRR